MDQDNFGVYLYQKEIASLLGVSPQEVAHILRDCGIEKKNLAVDV